MMTIPKLFVKFRPMLKLDSFFWLWINNKMSFLLSNETINLYSIDILSVEANIMKAKIMNLNDKNDTTTENVLENERLTITKNNNKFDIKKFDNDTFNQLIETNKKK